MERSISINTNSSLTIKRVLDTFTRSSGSDAHHRDLAQDIKMLLWEQYDPNDDIIYPTFSGWDDQLIKIIDNNDYGSLSKDEVLSMLFGLIHRNRIVEGLWWSMFERGVTQKLLTQLLVIDSSKYK